MRTARLPEITLLVGAGISVDPPSGFPIARYVVERILTALAPSDEWRPRLTALADPARTERRGPADYIRFELLLEVIQELADRDLAILRFTELFSEPNDLHGARALPE